MELLYRKLRPGEAAVYRALRLEALQRFPEFFGSTFEEEVHLPRLMYESAIEERTPDKFVVGAFSGPRLVGMAGFSRIDQRKKQHRGIVAQVYVDPEIRGRAVGSNLVRLAVELAFVVPGIEMVELSVVATNAAARRVYENLGFRMFGIQENHFRVGDVTWDQCFMHLTRERHLALAV